MRDGDSTFNEGRAITNVNFINSANGFNFRKP